MSIVYKTDDVTINDTVYYRLEYWHDGMKADAVNVIDFKLKTERDRYLSKLLKSRENFKQGTDHVDL